MVTYGFFDSIDDDRRYNADDISNYFLKLISDGVFATPANSMQVLASSGMTIKISPGWGFLKCKWINNDADCFLTLDAADIILNRADRIVLRLNRDTRNIEIAVKKGTPAENAYAPELQRDETIWELSLAYVYVWAGQTEITQADIADERWNTDVCGWVTGLIQQIDTTNLFAQYDFTFWNWFNNLHDNSISNMQNQLEIAESVIYPYPFPNVSGSATVSASDAALIQSFTASVGIGAYTNNPAGWMQFVADNDLPESSYPDANGDGVVNSQESADILEFVANAAIKKYSNDLAGWTLYMQDKKTDELQERLQKISAKLDALKQQFVPIVTLTQEAYDTLEEIDETTLYVIVDNSES